MLRFTETECSGPDLSLTGIENQDGLCKIMGGCLGDASLPGSLLALGSDTSQSVPTFDKDLLSELETDERRDDADKS